MDSAWQHGSARQPAAVAEHPGVFGVTAQQKVEIANMRAAIQWCLDRSDAHAAHRLAIALAGFWDSRSLLGEVGSLPSILADVAHVALDQGGPAAAREAADEALVIATRLGNAVGVASALDALGRCLLAEGDVGAAAEVWGESDALRRDLGHPVERRDQEVLRRERQIARDRLGEDAFAERWTRGVGRTAR